MSKDSFQQFIDIIRKLRSEDGCPWDREQTHESLKTCLIEECYETIEAINNQDSENLCEELGDLLLQIALHSVIAEEAKEFTVEEVIKMESEKMIRRHPHVFGETAVNNSDDVMNNWEEIKKKEKKANNIVEELQEIPKAFPANIRAEKIHKKLSKCGMNFTSHTEAFTKIQEQLEELKKAVEKGKEERIQDEYGMLLFTMIKLSLFLRINAENSLTNATNKFINRFVDVFTFADSKGQNLCEITTTEQEALWKKFE